MLRLVYLSVDRRTTTGIIHLCSTSLALSGGHGQVLSRCVKNYTGLLAAVIRRRSQIDVPQVCDMHLVLECLNDSTALPVVIIVLRISLNFL